MAKFLNSPLNNRNYTEVGQTNPLRWYLLEKVDGGFKYQSGIFKCKDYFNDLVSKYRGLDSNIYGFNTASMTLNEEGVYVRLVELIDAKVFEQNIAKVNEMARKDGFPDLVFDEVGDREAILLIPRKYFDCTWSTSLVTYLIRISNVAVVIADIQNHPTKAVDCPFRNYYDRVFAQGFKPPLAGHWYYAMKDYTNLTKPFSFYSVHDNGVAAWMSFVDVEGIDCEEDEEECE